MKSVISEIFCGEKCDNIVRSEKYLQMKRTAEAVYDNFLNTLDDKQKS